MSAIVVDNTVNNNIIVDSTNTVIVSTGTTDKIILSGAMGPRGINTINTALDIDISQISDGSTLLYSNNTSKWTATNTSATKILSADLSQLVNGATLIYNSSSDTWAATNNLQEQIISAGFF